MKTVKKWLGNKPENCECCGGKIGSVFYDCYIPGGAWGLICNSCFADYNCKLGMGCGQKYDTKTLEKLN